MSPKKKIEKYLNQLRSNDPSVRLPIIYTILDNMEGIGEVMDFNEEFNDAIKEIILTMLERLEAENQDYIKLVLPVGIWHLADSYIYSYEWIIKKLEKIHGKESDNLIKRLLELQKERDEYIEEELIDQITHRMKKFRLEAVEELGTTAIIKNNEGILIENIIDVLVDCLNDKEEIVADRAGHYLFNISNEYVKEKLFLVLKKKRAYTAIAREKAIKAISPNLAEETDEKFVDELKQILQGIILDTNEIESLRSIALWGFVLAESGFSELIEFLYDRHINDESIIIREEAYDFLNYFFEELGYKKSDMEKIISEIKNGEIEIDENEIDEEIVLSNIIKDLRPSSVFQRFFAADKIGELDFHTDEVIQSLINSIAFDESDKVRQISASVLLKIESPFILESLNEIISNPDYDSLAKKYSIEILRKRNIKKSFYKKIKLLIKDKDSLVRSEVALYLSKLGTTRDLPDLVTLLFSDESVNVRLNSLKAIFAIDQSKSLPHLLKVIKQEKSSKIREIAIDYFEVIDSQDLDVYLKEIIQQDSSYRVREKAKEIFLKIGKDKQKIINEIEKLDKPKISKQAHKEAVKFLFVAANPDGDNFLRQGREIRYIEDKLEPFNNKFVLKQKWAINPGDITELFRFEPHFIHITCHGTDTGDLVFEDDNGKNIFYSAKDLARRFKDAKKAKKLNNLHCVLISACHSELIASELVYSVDCIIAMSDLITDDGARKFAGQFYKELFYSENLLSAFQNACEELIIEQEKDIPDIYFKLGMELKKLNFHQEIVNEESLLHDEDIREPFKTITKKLKRREKVSTKKLLTIIKEGENELVELKSTLRWNKDRNIPNRKTEYRIAKSIASFMNSKGGILFIGVGDNGEIRGIEKDFSTLGSHQNKDGFSNQLKNVINSNFDDSYTYLSLIHDNYYRFNGKEICVIFVEPSPNPVYINEGGTHVFFVRYFAQSKKISGKKHLEYIKNHWKA